MFFFLQYVFSSSTPKGSILQRIIGAGVEAAGAGKAVGLEGLSLNNSFGGSRGTGPSAFSAIKTGVLIDPDFEDAHILNQPTEQPEGADKHAIRPVMDQGEPENEDYEDRSRDLEVPFEKPEGVEIPVQGLILYT
jgi:hypothetical protein